MPRSKRDEHKRVLAQAYNHLDYAVSDILELEELFRKDHPMYADVLLGMTTGVSLLQQAINRFVTEVWGYAPQDWEQWRSNWPKKHRQALPEVPEDMFDEDKE